jgi:hypothetical protein
MSYRSRYEDVQDDEPSQSQSDRQTPREQVTQLLGVWGSQKLIVSDPTLRDTRITPLPPWVLPEPLLRPLILLLDEKKRKDTDNDHHTKTPEHTGRGTKQ